MAATQKNRALAISTALGADALLLKSFTVSEQLGRLFQIEAELYSENPELDFDALVGTNTTIRLSNPAGKTRFFNGTICRFAQTGTERDFTTYRATIVPWLWLLTRSADCRIFQKKKVPEIIEAVFKTHGFKDYKLKLNATYREWEYCVQYRETDFNFVSRLMEQEGIYYYFEHADGEHHLVLIDSLGAHETFPDYDTLTYKPRVQAREEHSETVTDWLIEREVQSGIWALADFNFKTPTSSLRANANISRSYEHAGFEIFDYPGEFGTRPEGEAYAKLRIQEVHSQHEILRGQATIRGLAAGFKFTLKGHFREDQNRAYLATGTALQASTGAYESGGGEAGDFFSCSFTAIAATEIFRSARITPRPLIQGPQTAIVVGRTGEEIDPDEYGRVKVQFHWDRYGKADENSSCWVRVSQPWAGKGWGAINIPRIGQEVVVEFLEGDPDQPIITGRVYNALNKVPYGLPDFKTISTLKTSTSKGGSGFNEIRFDDKKDEEQIFIHAERNQDVRVKNDSFESIGHDQHLGVKNDQFEHIENNREEIVDADHKEKIGKDRHLNVTGKEAKSVGGSLSLSVKGNVIEVFKSDHSEQTTKDFYLKAENVVIEAVTNLTLQVGKSYIAMEAGGIKLCTLGTIDHDATGALSIKSAAEVSMTAPNTSIKGDAQVAIQGAMVKIN